MSPAEIVAREIEPQARAAAGVGDTLAYRNRRVSSERKAHRILAALEAAGYVIAPVGDGWSTDMSVAPKTTPVIVELPENEVRQREWQHGLYQVAANRGMGWISIPGLWRCHPVAWRPIPTRPR
jgi:hypothetical protein